ncbi:hypothetical protein C7445_1374 [Alicyclobacillus sacchari]|uniref:Uncharacterized protein n=1 Tax=Alicyclobacillus sacchari TaxID=392010 RepID=A0A4R8L7E1_9BACL|nr:MULTISPECIES: hypothetical protein [Alicyclobacillus]TDY38255.1 hypothetical protein C7445_1374 [Alicyclobacillus sacchari]GMA59364.1 hypothetical protein GCM10025858_38670 [Alicyclobacillus sacchari]
MNHTLIQNTRTKSGREIAKETRKWLRSNPDATLSEAAKFMERMQMPAAELGRIGRYTVGDLPEYKWICIGEDDLGCIEVAKDLSDIANCRYREKKARP